MTNFTPNRRRFIKDSTLLASVPLITILPSSARGANDRIEIGIIGCGDRAQNALMEEIRRFSSEENVVITAVCDVWNQHRESAANKIKDWYDVKAQSFVDYHDLLALPNIDAVVIATPDHHHAKILFEAIQANKDVYCEKPLARNLDELHKVVDAVKQSDRVVQMGTQLRSYPSFTGCKKMVQDGTLGKIIKVAQTRNYYKPYWYSFDRPLKESDTHWKLFLGDVAYRPFNANQHTAWYGYDDFTDGSISNIMCHFIDLVHYITGAEFPTSAVTMCGNYAWDDQYTVPDSVHTLLDYPDGFMVSYTTSCGNENGNYTKFWGKEGMIDATSWRNPFMTGEGSKAPDRIKEKQAVPDVDIPHHMQNWLQCLRTRKQPNAHIDAGYQHAVACLLADAAWKHNCKMIYDQEKRTFKPA